MRPAHAPRPRPLAALFAAIAASGALVAQGGDLDPVATVGARADTSIRRPDPTRRAPRPGLARFCSIDTATRRGRVVAGSAGVLVITVTARPGFAIDARELLSIDCASNQQPLRLDAFHLLERGPGSRDVPADYLVLTVPFRVERDAAPGPHPVSLTLATAIVERPGDRSLGLLREPLTATVSIDATSAANSTTATTAGHRAARSEPRASEAEAEVLGTRLRSPLSTPTPRPPTVAPDAHAPADLSRAARTSRVDLRWIGVGAFALLACVLRRLFSSRS